MAAKFLSVAVLSLALACSFAKEIRTTLVHGSERSVDKDHVPFPGYFDDAWRQIYNEEHLVRQPKWKLVKNQPEDASYEVREYDPAWYVTSHIPCVKQNESASSGYIRLFNYVLNARSIGKTFPLTYPILSKIELNGEERAVNRSEEELESQKEPMRLRCHDRFSQRFYLPIPLTQTPPQPHDVTLSTEIVPAKTYYVQRYEDKFDLKTQENCNVRAGHLAIKLALSGVRFDPRSYFCAMYEPGNRDDVTALFEVWFPKEI